MTSTAVRFATPQDEPIIHTLAAKVQAALTAVGSPQTIAPLHDVDIAVEQQGCFVLDQAGKGIIGCAIVRPLPGDYYLDSDFIITAFPEPRLSLHSMMLAPSNQGQGVGRRFFQGVMAQLKGRAKSVVLDCWAGNEKLRTFYTDAGCTFVGIAREHDYDIAIFVCSIPSEEELSGRAYD